MKASPTVPFPFWYHHSQSNTFILKLKSHTTYSLVILNLTTPFLSTGIHQCILIKSDIQFHPPLRLQPTPPSPHSIHSNHNSTLLSEFKFIHFTPLLWQSQTTPSPPHSTTPFNTPNPTKESTHHKTTIHPRIIHPHSNTPILPPNPSLSSLPTPPPLLRFFLLHEWNNNDVMWSRQEYFEQRNRRIVEQVSERGE